MQRDVWLCMLPSSEVTAFPLPSGVGEEVEQEECRVFKGADPQEYHDHF